MTAFTTPDNYSLDLGIDRTVHAARCVGLFAAQKTFRSCFAIVSELTSDATRIAL